jgi:hypothetical protein
MRRTLANIKDPAFVRSAGPERVATGTEGGNGTNLCRPDFIVMSPNVSAKKSWHGAPGATAVARFDFFAFL